MTHSDRRRRMEALYEEHREAVMAYVSLGFRYSRGVRSTSNGVVME